MNENIKEFETFKNWCKVRNLKASNAISLYLYMRFSKINLKPPKF